MVEVRAEELRVKARRPGVDLLELQPVIAELQRGWRSPGAARLAELLDGDWELLFASRPALASSGLDAFPGVQRGRTYQCIDAAAGRVWNLTELHLPLGICSILVRARFAQEGEVRLRVHFEQTALVWGALAEFGAVPGEARARLDAGAGWGVRLGLASEGTVDTLYIDDAVRVGLGNRGTVFVLERV